MKPTNFAIALAGVFVVATFVTGLALTLFSSVSGARFLPRFCRNTLRYAWAAGLAAAVVFWFSRPMQ